MNIKRIFAILFILACSTAGWVVLGGALSMRTLQSSSALGEAVGRGWGPALTQMHPIAWFLSPGTARPRIVLQPETSDIRVKIGYEPRKKGLLWHRTYLASFSAEYEITNPAPVTQTVYMQFKLPDPSVTYYDFSFRVGEGAPSGKSPDQGVLTEAVVLPAGGTTTMRVTYGVRGTDRWAYGFEQNARVRGFALQMETDFTEIDFPAGSGSPTDRTKQDSGWKLLWQYPDVLSAQSIAMEMPAVVNAGPVAARIAFFAPVSLLFFFSVMVIMGAVKGFNLHPMNYFFLAAGFFAFHLLFAYLVDVLSVHASFAIAAVVSLLLVTGYVHVAGRGRLTKITLISQTAFMVLFSYSFFFSGVTGLTVTIGSVATLAVLMAATARIDWSARFAPPQPPPVPE